MQNLPNSLTGADFQRSLYIRSRGLLELLSLAPSGALPLQRTRGPTLGHGPHSCKLTLRTSGAPEINQRGFLPRKIIDPRLVGHAFKFSMRTQTSPSLTGKNTESYARLAQHLQAGSDLTRMALLLYLSLLLDFFFSNLYYEHLMLHANVQILK